MKKIIRKNQESITIDDLNNDSIVGIQWKLNSKSKSFIRFFKGNFIGCGLFRTNFDGNWHRESLKEYAKEAMEGQGADLFLFESYGELFNWLKEK